MIVMQHIYSYNHDVDVLIHKFVRRTNFLHTPRTNLLLTGTHWWRTT